MRGAWELEDGTRVTAKIEKSDRWNVCVNGAKVPSTTKPLGMIESDTAFSLAQGREARVTLRKSRAGLLVDLHVDGHVYLYPGRRPFRCPACRRELQAYERTCARCRAVVPDRAQRMQERRRSRLFWGQLGTAGVLCAYDASHVASTLRDPRAAMARLQLSLPSSTHDQLRDAAISHAWSQLNGLGFIVAALIGLAFLSRRAPLTASVLNLALWTANEVVVALSDFRPKMFAMTFGLVFIWGAYVHLRLALEMREVARVR
jgi:hypothetical protein